MMYRHAERIASRRHSVPGEIPAGLIRSAVMSNMVVYLMAGLTMIITALAVFGLPALAIVIVKYLKFKERELTLEVEYRQKAHERQLAHDERVQRLEDVLTSLDHDVRERLGIGQSPTSLPSNPELLEGPGAPAAEGAQPLDRSRAKAR